LKSGLEESEMYWLEAQEELEIKQKEFEIESLG
jgi:ATP-binding cassette subfamily F protein 3